MQYTFKELLDSYNVIVPLLQRDYAQGRESEFDLRKDFVGKIKKTLQNDLESLNLDFVYGYTEKIGNDKHAFIPLDGQQRLTTLWLLHWFLAPRENNEIAGETKSYLTRFTYETRVSSKRFCSSLIIQSLYINDNIVISQQIKDSPWFMASWIYDPTIVSMLNMLDTLQKEGFDKILAWENLVANRKITFDYIDIKSDEFKLTDELYIKMNSRGKPLTQFENFKAQFSSLLSSKETNYTDMKLPYQDTNITYQQYFAFKIDSVWMDLFWSYRVKYEKLNITLDNCIYRFINYIAEFLFYKNNPGLLSSEIKIDFEFLNKMFSEKENIDFLFNSLDLLSEINNIEEFFKSLFDDLSTFDNYSKDYFLRAITDTGLEVSNKIILYATLSYGIKLSLKTIDEDFKDFIRIVRNLLISVRQINSSRRIEYTTNLRLPNVSDYCKFIDDLIEKKKAEENKTIYQLLSENEFSGFTKENISNEKSKAAIIVNNPNIKKNIHLLEEHSHIQGNTANFKLNSEDINLKINAFLKIWDSDTDNSLIIRAFLTVGDYSVMTHWYSSLGQIWYFGSKNYWGRLLTAFDKEEKQNISDSLDLFLTAFSKAEGTLTSEKLMYLITNFNTNVKDWRYYFIKYEPITKNPYLSLNLFVWSEEEGFNINCLGNSGTHPLHSYHLNPYLIVLKNIFGTRINVDLYWGRFAYTSYIEIDKKIRLRVNKSGWIITPINNYIIKNELISKFNLSSNGTNYTLSESEPKDRIELITDFINEIFDL